MKPALFALSLALLGAPTLASAQPAPDQQGAPAPHGQRNPEFAQFHQQMRQLHEQARANMLGALSPANRQLLANVIGQLAVSTSPDYKGAAARLDRSLSSNERSAVLQVAQNFHTQLKALHEQMKASMPPPPDGQAGPDGNGPPRQMGRAGLGVHQMSAGQILLHLGDMGMRR